MIKIHIKVLVRLLEQHRVVAKVDESIDDLKFQSRVRRVTAQSDQVLIETGIDTKPRYPYRIVDHLIRRLRVLSKLITSKYLHVPPQIPIHESQSIRETTFAHFLEN